jgi:predicted transcriptional regulator
MQTRCARRRHDAAIDDRGLPERIDRAGDEYMATDRATIERRQASRRVQVCYSVVQEMTMTTLTIRLDPKLDKSLERLAKITGRTKSEIAREALRRQVAVARFRALRKKTLPFAEAQGLVTDEDVFRALS